MLAEWRYFSLVLHKIVPAKDLVRDILHVVKLEENVIGFEHLLQVRVAKFCHQVNFVKVLRSLIFGQYNFDHAHDVGVLAVFEQYDFTQYPSGFRARLE